MTFIRFVEMITNLRKKFFFLRQSHEQRTKQPEKEIRTLLNISVNHVILFA